MIKWFQSPKEAIVAGIVAVVAVFFTYSMVTEPPGAKNTVRDADNVERLKGFHCLSKWDGSNRSTVDQIEPLLRNPDSFEHIETRIRPLDVASNEHGLTMTYRAENGFGGMTIGRIEARVNHDTCEARLTGSPSG